MKSEERTIAGVRYRMEQMGALSGNAVMLRLARPVAAGMAEAFRKGGSPTTASVARAIEAALAVLSSRDLRAVAKAFAWKTAVFLPDGGKLREWPLADHFDEHFAGRYGAELQFLRWGVEMNHFFDDVLALLPKGEGKAKSSGSPKASTAGDGGSSSIPSA